MTHDLRLHPAAERELVEAVAFYEAESPGLGSAFVDEVERVLRQICEFPEASPVALGPVRRKTLAAFPYSVVYSVIGEAIIVLAFAHQRRRPFYWQGRE